VTKLISEEKNSWVNDHSLKYDPDLRELQLKSLNSFGKDLQLRYADRAVLGRPYQHFWVTDGNWVIEFGGGELLDNSVLVHHNPVHGPTYTEAKFKLTEEVMERMKLVCGAKNYSLALRNCEHLARYIHSGAWISFQMVGNGVLKKHFVSYMGEHTKLINILPLELQPIEFEKHPLYPEHEIKEAMEDTGSIKFSRMKKSLTATDNDRFNIVFLGSGKSHLINNLFNLTVSPSRASLDSVTKEIRFYEGICTFVTMRGWRRVRYNRPVNVIDTIGFCDSVMSPADVLEAIKLSVKVNASYIDKVVIVCSGRMEKAHADSIRALLGWLKFKQNRNKFVFILNKSDLLSEVDKQHNLAAMLDRFDVNTEQRYTWTHEDGSVDSMKMNLALGLSPDAKFADVEHDHRSLTKAVLMGSESDQYKRIAVDKSSCNIL